MYKNICHALMIENGKSSYHKIGIKILPICTLIDHYKEEYPKLSQQLQDTLNTAHFQFIRTLHGVKSYYVDTDMILDNPSKLVPGASIIAIEPGKEAMTARVSFIPDTLEIKREHSDDDDLTCILVTNMNRYCELLKLDISKETAAKILAEIIDDLDLCNGASWEYGEPLPSYIHGLNCGAVFDDDDWE